MNHAQSTLDEDAPHVPAPSRGRAGVPTVVQFTEFEFDFERDQLRRNGTPIPLSPKPSSLLRYFLANPQRLISKSELMESLWADVVVTDDSLVQCVGELRNRMGDQGPNLITTLPRRGYMFDADVRPVGVAPSVFGCDHGCGAGRRHVPCGARVLGGWGRRAASPWC